MEYIPKPIDLSGIELSEDLQRDMDHIARNIHENWAYQRKRAGWGYGNSYNAVKKEHPCLKEYDNLPDIEKKMDHVTVEQTIKTLLWLGYVIEKRENNGSEI